MTRLEIINQMLAVLGTAPLTSEDEQHPDYIEASAQLAVVEDATNSMGWWYNKVTLTLSQTVDGEVILPAGTLSVDPKDQQDGLVWRGNRLFDPKNNTFNIGRTVEAKVLLDYDLAELPVHAQLYMLAEGKYTYYLNKDGANPRLTALERARDRAWINLKNEDLRNKDVNINNNATVTFVKDLRNVGRGRSLNPNLPGGRVL